MQVPTTAQNEPKQESTHGKCSFRALLETKQHRLGPQTSNPNSLSPSINQR
jgi:hypothetical protein